ncbi:hypothetical protein DENSPDRAFT_886566 [Dentipellis sp. KUC8613]|nr:hypothetical protein DENSPDRAFT_886566 [Dentipellis sp. KUC8613]
MRALPPCIAHRSTAVATLAAAATAVVPPRTCGALSTSASPFLRLVRPFRVPQRHLRVRRALRHLCVLLYWLRAPRARPHAAFTRHPSRAPAPALPLRHTPSHAALALPSRAIAVSSRHAPAAPSHTATTHRRAALIRRPHTPSLSRVQWHCRTPSEGCRNTFYAAIPCTVLPSPIFTPPSPGRVPPCRAHALLFRARVPLFRPRKHMPASCAPPQPSLMPAPPPHRCTAAARPFHAPATLSCVPTLRPVSQQRVHARSPALAVLLGSPHGSSHAARGPLPTSTCCYSPVPMRGALRCYLSSRGVVSWPVAPRPRLTP